ncbi:hypothetical protein J2X83_004107 [Brevibacillus nitrificans]|nr:hypothetical protein [Brevibacillus nitrificans]
MVKIEMYNTSQSSMKKLELKEMDNHTDIVKTTVYFFAVVVLLFC